MFDGFTMAMDALFLCDTVLAVAVAPDGSVGRFCSHAVAREGALARVMRRRRATPGWFDGVLDYGDDRVGT